MRESTNTRARRTDSNFTQSAPSHLTNNFYDLITCLTPVARWDPSLLPTTSIVSDDVLFQSLTDKVGAAVKPDSQKTTGEQFSDTVKGKADGVASTLQPQVCADFCLLDR